MSLEVQFSNGTILPAREAVLTRALGRAVRWRYEVYVPHVTRRDDLQKVLDAMASQRVLVASRFVGTTEAEDAEFGLEGVATHAWWGERPDHAVIEVQCTRLGEETPNPLLPRWRIHHVDDLYKLAQKFGHLVQLGGPRVKNALSSVTFPDADRANVVQAGVSDWDFVAHLVWQYRLLGKDAGLKPMILSGSVVPSTENKWVYTWGCHKAFETAGEIASRTITFKPEDGYSRPMFAGATGGDPGRHAVIPGADVPRAGVIRHRRPFTEEAWINWREKDVPLFLDGTMCWRVVDRLYDTGQPDVVGWTSMLEFMPAEGLVSEEFPALPPRAWMGAGTVKKNYVKGPWIDIELPAFVTEQKENLVHTRLTTIHSGKQGHAGLHLIPEKDTHVDVAWSGRFDQSVVCTGNRRMKDTRYPHPSLWIESNSIGQFADIKIPKIGKTHIESDWKVDIEKQTVLRSEKPMTLIGDGVKAEYKSGVIHISKGRPASMKAPAERGAQDPIDAMAEPGQAQVSSQKLSLQEHLDLMKAAEAKGTETVTVKTAAGTDRQIRVHGANPAELAVVSKALQDLAATDKCDLIMKSVSDVHLTDALSKDTLGVAIRQGDKTPIVLSRCVGQAKRNMMEVPLHVKKVLYHEIGHALDNQHMLSGGANSPFGTGDQASTGEFGDFVSKYATTNPREDYAETFSKYHMARTDPAYKGYDDQDVITLTCYGGKSQDKMKHMHAGIPEVHCKDAIMERSAQEGGAKQVIGNYYEDPKYRQQYVKDVTTSKPGVTPAAVDNHMAKSAGLFGVTPTKKGGVG